MKSGESGSNEIQPLVTSNKRGISSPEETGPDIKIKQNLNSPNIAQLNKKEVEMKDGDMMSEEYGDLTGGSPATDAWQRPACKDNKTWEDILQAIHEEVRSLRLSNQHLNDKVDLFTSKVSEMQDSIN